MTPDKLIARWHAFYALTLYLPFSEWARAWRARRRAARGVNSPHQQSTRLRPVSWTSVLRPRPIYLVETRKQNGNVRVSELAVLAQAAAAVKPADPIIEIGTFDGRTTLNLAVNSPPASRILTLDLPADHPTRFELAKGERQFVDKPAPGARFRNCPPAWAAGASRIDQVLGDSATYEWSPHYGKAGLVFVDGSHAYEYALKDSETAFKLAARDGMILWHDYGVWEGVTRALEELQAKHDLGLCPIRGTSLVFWRGRGAGLQG